MGLLHIETLHLFLKLTKGGYPTSQRFKIGLDGETRELDLRFLAPPLCSTRRKRFRSVMYLRTVSSS
jgi:hypothetical protein